MSTRISIRQGDCLASLAKEAGFFPDTLWEHADNAALRERRKSMHALLPGDELVIPEKREKLENGAIDKRHRFRRKGVPAELVVRFVVNNKARADTPYKLTIDGITSDGSTDAGGWVRVPIPPDARAGEIILYPKDEPEESYALDLGCLDPHDERAGALKRLANLGYFAGDPNGPDEQDARAAIAGFQKAQGLGETEELDDQTTERIKELHRS